jgi:hypothetical protein
MKEQDPTWREEVIKRGKFAKRRVEGGELQVVRVPALKLTQVERWS